jgi:hypothetical protein
VERSRSQVIGTVPSLQREVDLSKASNHRCGCEIAPWMATHPIGESKHPSICVSSVLVPLTDRSAIAASGEVEPQLPAHYRSIVTLSSLRSQTWSQRGSVDRESPRRVGVCLVTLDELERRLRGNRIKPSGRLRAAELLHVLMLPDLERGRADRRVLGSPETRTFGEVLFDGEEDRVLHAVLVGMLVDP